MQLPSSAQWSLRKQKYFCENYLRVVKAETALYVEMSLQGRKKFTVNQPTHWAAQNWSFLGEDSIRETWGSALSGWPNHQDIRLIIRTIRLDMGSLWFTLSNPSMPPLPESISLDFYIGKALWPLWPCRLSSSPCPRLLMTWKCSLLLLWSPALQHFSRSESFILNSGLADHLASKAHYYAWTW